LIPKFRNLMHPNSTLLVCDIGQEINVNGWMFYLLRENFKREGLWKTVKLFQLSTELKSANKDIQAKQQNGNLWKHDLVSFKAWFSKEYEVLSSLNCYRGCSNFLVCKPLENG